MNRIRPMIYIDHPTHLEKIDASQSRHPSTLTVVTKDCEMESSTGTYFGYVLEGKVTFVTSAFSGELTHGSFFSATGRIRLSINHATVVLIERMGFKGMSYIGHREKEGRLNYIDGCTDSVLVFPATYGDPVLNHLHFPSNIIQSQHTHPSIRLGIIAEGNGIAFGPNWETPMKKGGVFMLDEGEVHSFKTKDGHMDVIAYHPDSNWGPTNEVHPMLNRTILEKKNNGTK